MESFPSKYGKSTAQNPSDSVTSYNLDLAARAMTLKSIFSPPSFAFS